MGGDVIPLTGIPGTPAEVRGLEQRREILRDQLERATNRRESLLNQLSGENGRQLAPEAHAGIQQRLAILDERILQIERDQALTERQLSNAPAEVLALAEAESYQNRGDTMDEDEALAMGFGMFTFGIVVAVLVGRVRRWRRPKPQATSAAAAGALAATDPRIDRLAHTVEAMAEEMERIGEGQRFLTQLMAGRPEPSVLRGDYERP